MFVHECCKNRPIVTAQLLDIPRIFGNQQLSQHLWCSLQIAAVNRNLEHLLRQFY
ncbi:hypothetical protein AVEN_19947-1, partial [Araneus ventricosus]